MISKSSRERYTNVLSPYLALIDRETSGNRCDVTPLFDDYIAFSALVDEWIETGAQIRAAIALIERQGGIIAGIASLHIDDNEQTESLRARYQCVQAAPDI